MEGKTWYKAITLTSVKYKRNNDMEQMEIVTKIHYKVFLISEAIISMKK